MKRLIDLKTRLEKLPERISERKLLENFDDYTKKVSKIREKLEDSKQSISFIQDIYPESKCIEAVLPKLNSSAKEAKKLLKSIENNPQKITSQNTSNQVLKIRDLATSAKSKCDEIWEEEISRSVTKWENIAKVVQSLGTRGGKSFKDSVDTLKKQEIPKNHDQVERIKKALEELQSSVANLGLEGPFGKFLEATAERKGASVKQVFDKEIKDKLDRFELWDSFRVNLSQ